MVQNNTKFKQSEIGEIPENWKVDSMCNICNVVTDYVANGSFASLKKHVKYSDIPDFAILIRLSDFNNGFRNNFVYVNKNGYEYLKKTKLFGKEIIISNVGAYSGTTFLTPILKQPMTLGPNSIMIKTKYNDNFYYYWLTSSLGQSSINDIKSGSAVPKFNKTDFKRIKAPIPPIDEQKQIASILSSLDDKIELNQKTIKTLEEIGQVLFKRWFIDFEFPNEKGDSYKSNGGEMVDSELGEIPKGWSVSNLESIGTFLNGLALQKYPKTGEDFLYAIKIKELNNGITESTDKVSTDVSKEYVVDCGDLLFSWSGSLDVVIWGEGKGALNQHLFKVTSDLYPKWFVYSWIKQHISFFQMIAASKATTMGHIQRKHLTEALVTIPPKAILNKADELLQPILDLLIEKKKEIQTLTKTKNYLLPKLLSGKIRV